MAMPCPPFESQDLPRIHYTDHAKRKLDGIPESETPKRVKMTGPFVMDDDDDDDDDSINVPHYPSLPDNSAAGASSDHSRLSHLGSQANDTPQIISPHINDDLQLREVDYRGNTVSSKSGGVKLREDNPIPIRGCSGSVRHVQRRIKHGPLSYEKLIANRSVAAPGKATKSYYGIDIHTLLDEAKIDTTLPTPNIQQSIEPPACASSSNKGVNHMWTEKYRARKFKDLIGDDRTHRGVLRWLKGWDPIVFPGLSKSKPKNGTGKENEQLTHRKILLLTGPPGLGKTTLAHVCAKQAGYEVLEINASDERSRQVVKGRIKDAVGTENVKGVTFQDGGKTVRKTGKPVCVVVDEVDGVVSGAGGGGEGGFIKALIDLVQLDEKNSTKPASSASGSTSQKKKKSADKFRLLRPVILICNDVYHPSLRPLRTSSIAEVIHVRRVPFDQVVLRVKNIFEKEGIKCEADGVRKLCEVSWGLSSTKDRASTRGVADGDIRGVLVEAEWIAHKLRYGGVSSSGKLTKKWFEQHILRGASGDGLSRGLGRGGTKEIVERVFLDGAGFPYNRRDTDGFQDPFSNKDNKVPVGVSDLRKRAAITRLREMVDASGEYDRCITDCFLTYPTQTYQDDTLLSKPNAAYDWLHFHDLISSKIFSNQDWELNPYLSQASVAFHHLFASANKQGDANKPNPGNDDEEDHPFTGPRADFAAFEARKQNHSTLSEFQSSLSTPLLRMFRSTESISTELIPNLTQMLSPNIKPIVVGGRGDQSGVASVRKESERAQIKAAVRTMHGVGVAFEKTRVESEIGAHAGWIYRMEPPLDTLTTFSRVKKTPLGSSTSSAPVRFAVRQILDQEYRKDILKRQSEAQQARGGGTIIANPSSSLPGGLDNNNDIENSSSKAGGLNKPKRDFFGRIIANSENPRDSPSAGKNEKTNMNKEMKVWVSYREGFSNAVRKRVSMAEILSGL